MACKMQYHAFIYSMFAVLQLDISLITHFIKSTGYKFTCNFSSSGLQILHAFKIQVTSFYSLYSTHFSTKQNTVQTKPPKH